MRTVCVRAFLNVFFFKFFAKQAIKTAEKQTETDIFVKVSECGKVFLRPLTKTNENKLAAQCSE